MSIIHLGHLVSYFLPRIKLGTKKPLAKKLSERLKIRKEIFLIYSLSFGTIQRKKEILLATLKNALFDDSCSTHWRLSTFLGSSLCLYRSLT